VAVAGLALLTACTGGPEVVREPGTSTRQARLALELADERGAVRGRVHGLGVTPGRETEARILDVFADAVPARRVRFTTTAAAAEPVLVVTHGLAAGADPCAARPAVDAAQFDRVTAAFCEQAGVIGAVGGTLDTIDDAARTRLYRRLSRELFPDLYAERYGFGNPPFNIFLGATFGF